MLAGLIKADRALALGEVGVLDGPKRTKATVAFDNAGTKTTVRYRLEAVDGKWRIADISEPSLQSLRRVLATGIASRAKELAK